jgi:putative ABC transport system permease protein
MILLRLISLHYVRKHLLRTGLTIAGIVLGVAVFVGMHTANQSVLRAFSSTVDRIAGTTQLQITAGEVGFPEEVLEKVQAVPEVRVAVPVIEAVVSTPFKGAGNLLILAVDMTGDRSLRDYTLESGEESVIEDPLVFLAQPDSLIVTNTFAETHRTEIGTRIPMQTMQGEKQFVVRGIMKSGGLTSAFGGNLAIMDVYAAQAVFGRGRSFDRIDLAVLDGVHPDDVARKLTHLLGPTYEIQSPSSRGQHFEALSRVYGLTANITSLFALFIGLFIIFNTFSIAVTQRRSEIGILRALGATRRQIRTLFLAESVVIGLAGSVAGIGLGLLMARGMAGYISDMLGEVYGVGERTEQIAADPRLLLTAVIIGTITSVIAAFIPARNAAGIDPVKALQKGRYQIITAGENRLRRALAVVLAAAATACVMLARGTGWVYVGYLLAITSGVLLTPTATAFVSRVLRPLLKRISPVEGALAADSLIQSPRRTSGTVAALMLSIALVIGLGGLAKASYMYIVDWMDVALNPDLFVTTSESLTRRSFRFPGSLAGDLRAVPGVAEVQAVRSGRVIINGKPVMLTAADAGAVYARAPLTILSGSSADLFGPVARGEALSVSENFAILHGYQRGDIVPLPSPEGVIRMPIAAIIRDFSDQQGSILLDLSKYRRHWKDDTINVFRVYLRRGADEAAVRRQILDRFGHLQRLFVLTNRDVRSYILRLTDQWFGLTYVQIAVAVLVAVLGIVNTLTVSITDRRRELGVLQAVGALRRQIRRTVWIEALSIGVIGLILGLAFGGVQLYYSLIATSRGFAGFRFSYEYPVLIALALCPVILGAALIAALAPAESAVRGSLVEALEYE